MRLRLWGLFKFFPRFLRELPYRGCYLVVAFAFARRLSDVEIGYRNSLALNRIEPFLSDLDVTTICGSQDRRAASVLFERLKRWLPVLGELNIYDRETMSSVVTQMNAFERERDPKLRSFRDRKGSALQIDAEKIVFAIRMLEADWIGLQSRPSTREKKWKGHFQDLGWARPRELDHASVLEHLLEKADFQDSGDIITSVIDSFRSGQPLHLHPQISHPAVQTLLFHRVCFSSPSQDLREKDWAVIEAQKKWEAWALHVVPALDPVSVTNHTFNMLNFSRASRA